MAARAQYPVFRDCLPLAIGIDKTLLARTPGLEKKVLRIALSLHTHSTRYLRAMAKATQRFDLDGNAVAEVATEHREHAATLLRERLKQQAEARRAEQKAAQAAEAERLRQEKLRQLAEKFSRK